MSIRRGLEQLLATPEADSIRAVERVKQHPGKMWVVDGTTDAAAARPVAPRRRVARGPVPGAARVYVQNSALEIAWTRVVEETGTREGRVLAPFFTAGYEGLNIDDEDDLDRARRLLEAVGRAPGRRRATVSWRA